MKNYLISLSLVSLIAMPLFGGQRTYLKTTEFDELTQEDRDFLAGSECCVVYENGDYFFRSGATISKVTYIKVNDISSSSGIFSTTYKKYVLITGENSLNIAGNYSYTAYHPLSIVTTLGILGGAAGITWKYMQQANKSTQEK